MNAQPKRSAGITRRGFLGAVGSAAALAALTDGVALAAVPEQDVAEEGEQVFSVQCRANCGGSCRLLAHVAGGKLVKLESADYPNGMYRGGCLKGYSYMYRMYSDTRIKQPMRRVGERGAGEWEAISWDEALEECATRLNAVVDEYGGEAVCVDMSTGQWASINGGLGIINRLSAVIGATHPQLAYDQNCCAGMQRLFNIADFSYCNEISSVMDATMIVSWGTNPCLTQVQDWRWYAAAHEQGAKLINIDISRSLSSYKYDEALIVKPGQDGYLALAMANYVLENDLQDSAYIREKTTGPLLVRADTGAHLRASNWPAESAEAFAGLMEEYAAQLEADPEAAAMGAIPAPEDSFYVWDAATGAPALLGEAADPVLEGAFTTEDGVEVETAYSLLKKQLSQYTVEDAEAKCGLPAERIRQLAESFATEEAVTVNMTFGTDHYLNGHLTAWAIGTLMVLCGQVAKPGSGFTGVFMGGVYDTAMINFWAGTPEFKGINTGMVNIQIPEVLATQKLEGRDYPLKAIISSNSNFLSNAVDQKYMIEQGIPNLDFWVVMDMEWTDSAMYADIVLPIASWYETEDLRVSYNNPYLCLSQKAVEPLYDTKSDLEAVSLLGRAMGFTETFPDGFFPENDMAFAYLFSDPVSQERGYTAERMREEIVLNYTEQPEGNAWIRGVNGWPTETGLIQLYNENPVPHYDYGQDLSDQLANERLVYYREPDEAGEDNPLAERFPYVFIQEHARYRTHSQFFDTPILRELDPEPTGKVNPAAAAAKGVKTGDYIEVFNDRGHAVVRCLEDEGIAPGVVSLAKGWQRSQYIAGCYSELTNGKMDPFGGSLAPYDSRVDFRKWEG